MPLLLWVLTGSDSWPDLGVRMTLRGIWNVLIEDTRNRRWHWDTTPPPRESVRTRWRHNQIFSAWWVTNFPYQWCFAGALRALNLHYNKKNSIEKSWRSGGALAFHQYYAACVQFGHQRHTWVDFVGSLLCSGAFLPKVLKFSPLTKNQNSNLIWFVVIQYDL